MVSFDAEPEAGIGMVEDSARPVPTVAKPQVYSKSEGLGRTSDIVWVTPALVDPTTDASMLVSPRHIEPSDDHIAELPASFFAEQPDAPTKLRVRSPVYGILTIDGLEPQTTVGMLIAQLRDRLVLPPTRTVQISSWGLPLDDERKTLQQYKLKTGGQIDMRTSLFFPDEDRALERVRIWSSALETRTIVVGKDTTGFDLKQSIARHVKCGEHGWYNKEGVCRTVTGVTLLATANVPANESAETSAIRLGEEFVTMTTNLGKEGEFGKGKPVSVIRVRRGGEPINIIDNNVVPLLLPPENQKISFHGADIADTANLFALGCRTDDVIQLEFVSPVMPPKLALLRAPEKEKPEKKGKGGKGGGKGKGKGKKKK